MTATDRISAAQVACLRYFAGLPDDTRGRYRTSIHIWQVCRTRGWLETIDTWPYSRTTRAGRLMLEREGRDA